MAPGTLKIIIKNCKVMCKVGLLPEEKLAPQPLVINVEIESRTNSKFDKIDNEDLCKTIDYSPIRDFIVHTLPTLGHIGLIETVAELVIEQCFKNPNTLQASVSVEKPNFFPEVESVGIQLTRKAY